MMFFIIFPGQVYLRGGQIRFIIVPDMFKNGPMLKRVSSSQGKKYRRDEIPGTKVRNKKI